MYGKRFLHGKQEQSRHKRLVARTRADQEPGAVGRARALALQPEGGHTIQTDQENEIPLQLEILLSQVERKQSPNFVLGSTWGLCSTW